VIEDVGSSPRVFVTAGPGDFTQGRDPVLDWAFERSSAVALGDAVPERKIIVSIATSADGYVARTDGNLDWLTRRPAPKGYYGLPEFSRSIDAKILGRKTFDLSVKMGARFSADEVRYVFSRRPPPASVPAGVQFVTEPIGAFAERLRKQAGKNIWMMGGGEIIGSFLDEDAIDEFIITVMPTFIGEGIPLMAPRHRDVPLRLLSLEQFPDGVIQLHYDVQKTRG
jgi:dihydrofolate reductase